jgi:hypothetical protein
MEMYRQCGVEVAIRKAGLGPEHTGLVVWTRTLAGQEIERRVPWRAGTREPGRQPGAQLPVRSGRPRTRVACLRRAPGAWRAAFRPPRLAPASRTRAASRRP